MDVNSNFAEFYQVAATKSSIEYGGKVIMPTSALDTLSRLNISYPMMFSIRNEQGTRQSHCGVLEFSAPEGLCYLPSWLMKHLGVQEGDLVELTSVTLPLGEWVQLQPQTTAFLHIHDHRAVLEHALRSFSALTAGDLFEISYCDTIYPILVQETRPRMSGISVIECDLQVEFSAPPGYQEPQPRSLVGSLETSASAFSQASFQPFQGNSNRLKQRTSDTDKAVTDSTTNKALHLPPDTLFFASKNNKQEVKEAEESKTGFTAFSGKGNKLK